MQSDIVARLREVIERALRDSQAAEGEHSFSDDCDARFCAEREMAEATRDAVIAEITALRERVAKLEDAIDNAVLHNGSKASLAVLRRRRHEQLSGNSG